MKFYSTARGFTLIEIMVVIGIISILSGIVYGFARQSSQTSRDIKRQSDLRALQSAVELYRQKIGHYPAGCNGADQWSGELGGAHACSGGSTQYIVGLAPEFISVLPRDPRRGTAEGYVYTTNAEGSVYKIMAMNTVESEVVGYTHPFKSCDYNGATNSDIRVDGYCGALYDGTTLRETETWTGHQCRADVSNGRFQKSYGVWGGFAVLRGNNTFTNPVDQCLSGYCVNNNPSDKTVDPLDSFETTAGAEVVAATITNASVKDTLRVRAVRGSTLIMCK